MGMIHTSKEERTMNRTGRWLAGVAVAAVMAGAGWAAEHDHAAATARSKAVEVSGEIVDIMCYSSMGREGGAGPKHKACATACINGGGPVGLLTDEDQLLLLVAAEHGDLKKMVAAFIATRVKVSGKISERGGLRVLEASGIVADTSAPRTIKKAAAAAATAEVWVCPMGCSKSDKAGKCPACGMDLVKQKS